jgi:uncharacterized protein (TIGR00369 family)
MYTAVFDKPVVAGEDVPFQLPAWIACAPFEEYLEMSIDEASEGKAVLSMPFKVKHSQGMGLMHGGAITALADTAVAMAIKSLLPEGSHFVTTEMTLRFVAPVKGGMVRAFASAVWRKERTLEGTADIITVDGTTAATFHSVFKIVRTPIV